MSAAARGDTSSYLAANCSTSLPGPAAPDCPHAAAGRLPAPRPRVISASKRTDLPAFYLPWFRARCQAGWVDVPNPLFRRAADPLQRLTHVSLAPEHVLAIVWWSKNYAVYERLWRDFARYPAQYFQFTINPRRADLAWLEPDVPPLAEALRQVAVLAHRHGPASIAWRYDPLMFWSADGVRASSWDAAFFEAMCAALARLGVRQAFTSVADPYAKVRQRLRRLAPGLALRDPAPDELAAIAATMQATAAAHGLALQGCAEPLLAAYGVAPGACIDGARLAERAGRRLPRAAATDRRLRGRETCGCTLHTDVGDYLTQECGYACVYCYANPNHRRFAAPPEQNG